MNKKKLAFDLVRLAVIGGSIGIIGSTIGKFFGWDPYLKGLYTGLLLGILIALFTPQLRESIRT